jgi:hypothetical protein
MEKSMKTDKSTAEIQVFPDMSAEQIEALVFDDDPFTGPEFVDLPIAEIVKRQQKLIGELKLALIKSRTHVRAQQVKLEQLNAAAKAEQGE